MADRAHGGRRRSWTAERPTAAHQSACADIRAVMCSNSGRRSQCRDDCASVIIINDEDVVVVDATRMPSQARKIIAAVRDLTKKPIRTLIHTHWHDDHVYGNQAFAEAFPGLEIVAHQNTREDMQEKALDLTAFRQKMAGSDKQRSADFDNYFVLPASARAYKEARGEMLGANPYED